jgi:WXG100 family type VII secretion target
MSEMFQTEQALKKASGMVVEARNDVDGKCKVLESDIQTLMAGWGGQGATSFNTLMVQWQDKQRQILQALAQLGEALEATDKDNVATDQAQAAATSNLTSRLG